MQVIEALRKIYRGLQHKDTNLHQENQADPITSAMKIKNDESSCGKDYVSSHLAIWGDPDPPRALLIELYPHFLSVKEFLSQRLCICILKSHIMIRLKNLFTTTMKKVYQRHTQKLKTALHRKIALLNQPTRHTQEYQDKGVIGKDKGQWHHVKKFRHSYFILFVSVDGTYISFIIEIEEKLIWCREVLRNLTVCHCNCPVNR